ncbi:hypothetical protein A2U01_0108399, partial [Trifolium medium]|nr:hypothetical protein [Trifolium medium]
VLEDDVVVGEYAYGLHSHNEYGAKASKASSFDFDVFLMP